MRSSFVRCPATRAEVSFYLFSRDKLAASAIPWFCQQLKLRGFLFLGQRLVRQRKPVAPLGRNSF